MDSLLLFLLMLMLHKLMQSLLLRAQYHKNFLLFLMVILTNTCDLMHSMSFKTKFASSKGTNALKLILQ